MLSNLNFDINLLCGQGYAGGANMSGAYRGAQAVLCKDYPLAIYTYCASHRLNLALGSACCILSIRNVFGTLENIGSILSRSAGRVLILENHSISTNNEKNYKKVIITLSN